jgi:hypothetical protein
MTKTSWLTVSALAISLGATSGGLAARAFAAPAPSQPQYEGQGRWDEPPSEYRDAQRSGFHDGIEAARRDFTEHRHRDADDHAAYKHPRVEHDLVSDYRNFARATAARCSICGTSITTATTNLISKLGSEGRMPGFPRKAGHSCSWGLGAARIALRHMIGEPNLDGA